MSQEDIVKILDSTPVSEWAWHDESYDSRMDKLWGVELKMRQLVDVPNERLQASLDRINKRREQITEVFLSFGAHRRADAPNPEKSLETFLGEYPEAPVRNAGEEASEYARRLWRHFASATLVEIWVDRFLFDAPRKERLSDEPQVWHQIARSTITPDGYVDRLFPLTYEGGRFRLVQTEPLAIYPRNEVYSCGDEFRYYAKHFERRKKWWRDDRSVGA